MKQGFTLLEMMIVLSVIAVVFLLSVPNISKVMGIINDKSCENQLKIVDTAILEFQLKYDDVPAGIKELVEEELLTERQAVCKNGKSIDIENGKAVIRE